MNINAKILRHIPELRDFQTEGRLVRSDYLYLFTESANSLKRGASERNNKKTSVNSFTLQHCPIKLSKEAFYF